MMDCISINEDFRLPLQVAPPYSWPGLQTFHTWERRRCQVAMRSSTTKCKRVVFRQSPQGYWSRPAQRGQVDI